MGLEFFLKEIINALNSSKNTVKSGEKAPYSGVLECIKCGNDLSIVKKRTVPPCGKCSGIEWKYTKITRD